MVRPAPGMLEIPLWHLRSKGPLRTGVSHRYPDPMKFLCLFSLSAILLAQTPTVGRPRIGLMNSNASIDTTKLTAATFAKAGRRTSKRSASAAHAVPRTQTNQQRAIPPERKSARIGVLDSPSLISVRSLDPLKLNCPGASRARVPAFSLGR